VAFGIQDIRVISAPRRRIWFLTYTALILLASPPNKELMHFTQLN